MDYTMAEIRILMDALIDQTCQELEKITTLLEQGDLIPQTFCKALDAKIAILSKYHSNCGLEAPSHLYCFTKLKKKCKDTYGHSWEDFIVS